MTRPAAGLARARSAGTRAVLFGVTWWAVAEGSGAGWGLGLVAVALATAASLRLQPPGTGTVRLRSLPRFAAWFLLRSAVGGADVARRALRRPVDIAPGEVEVPVRLPGTWPRVLLADAVSMLPGTLAVELAGDSLVLHVLDVHRPVHAEVARLETEVARLFGLEAPD